MDTTSKNLRDLNESEFDIQYDALSEAQVRSVCKKLGISVSSRADVEELQFSLINNIEDECVLRDALLGMGLSENHPCFLIKVPTKRKYTQAEADSGMVLEFHDSNGQRFHDEFQDWRRKHQNGYFLSFSNNNMAKLHETTGCWHVGNPGLRGYISSSDEASLTNHRKVCADNTDKLLQWAAKEGVIVKNCAHCFKGKPPPKLGKNSQI